MIYGIIFGISVALFGLWKSVKISASVLIIGILIAVVYNYLPQLKELYFRFKPEKTDTHNTNNTQKISAIGKTVLGALWKIVYWVIIAGLIAAAALVAYCFLFPSVETIYFTPNQLSGITIDLEEPGVYEIKVSGSYEQCFLRKSGKAWKRVRYPVSPNGIAPRRNWPSAECRRHLPLPSRPFGMVIAKIGEEGKFIPIGYGRKIKVNGPTTVHSNINVPPDWIDVPGKTPADNFIHNTGVLRITVERDRTIFEKIAEVLLSFKQYFKGDS